MQYAAVQYIVLSKEITNETSAFEKENVMKLFKYLNKKCFLYKNKKNNLLTKKELSLADRRQHEEWRRLAIYELDREVQRVTNSYSYTSYDK